MNHGFPPVNGNIYRSPPPFPRDPFDGPSNEELGITPYPWWVSVAFWAAAFIVGVLLWVWLMGELFARIALKVPIS